MAEVYYLIQWEDRLLSIIKKDKIVEPIKKVYTEGQLITAKYGKQKFEAVICEIHPKLKYLQEQTKLPPKYTYVEAKKCQQSEVSIRQQKDQVVVKEKGVTSQPASASVSSIWESDESDDMSPNPSLSMLETISGNSPRQDESDDGNISDASQSILSNSRPLSVPLSGKKSPVSLRTQYQHRKCLSCSSLEKTIERLSRENEEFKKHGQTSGLSSGKPKAGIVNRDTALEFSMVEVYPQTDVWWYRSQRDAVLFNGKEQPEQTMSRTTDVFFSKEVQRESSARGGGKYPQLNKAVLDACLLFIQKRWEIQESVLIKVVNDKCAHQRRPKRTGTYCREKYLQRKMQKNAEKR